MGYQDFVIKNGEFIGRFEEMYQQFEDPWEQSTRELYCYEKTIGLEIIKNNNLNKVLELGCGHVLFGSGHAMLRIAAVPFRSVTVPYSMLAVR